VRYLLDTNTCIAAIRQERPVLARLLRCGPDDLAVAVMTVAELWFGALKSRDAARGRAVVDAFLAPFAWLPFDDAAADRYATARHHLEGRGEPIGERDLIIAATALSRGLAVITSNTREFGRVPGLNVEDWSTA
jgi:tRNA(fMet)-specific endonuclease VapC